MNNIMKLKIMAGVPITKDDHSYMTESTDGKNVASRTISQFIRSLDFKVATSTNREYKAEYSKVASEFEDILVLVKAGKQNKATKLFNELKVKYKNSFFDNILPKNLDKAKEYFSSINEACSEDEESLDNIEIDTQTQSNDEVSNDIVQCPFCDTEINKIDFYDHMMSNHVEEDEPSDEQVDSENDEIEISFGEVPTENPNQVTLEAEDATVWDKTEDKDESPSGYIKDTDKIDLPKEIKSSLEKEIKELQKEAEALVKTDYKTAEFYNDTANAMIDVLNHLEQETEHDMKMAQVLITKYMSPIVQKFPKEVYDFIIHGGYDTKLNTSNSLVNLFKEIKMDEKNNMLLKGIK